ncbi:hypothetical protein DFH08DRAFT_971559 [Mycena albidolilacea]|uniref:Uncharacterized protein n=1 Tax=Mycena albidolilacea TaxID=1033008 RepID=A0AAD6ZCM2_9AGAR|nr:hypothetical protein DFH08DRAFT_971559 [Mycena albidolilacea]
MFTNSDNNGTDSSTGENHPLGWFKGKKQANLAGLQVQELEEQEELEKKLEMARVEALAALLPEEWEERRKTDEAVSLALMQWLQEFKDETEHQICEAKESLNCTQTLHLLIKQGKATNFEKAGTVELLRPAEAPDAKDVPDEELELDDESTDLEADLKEVDGSRKWKWGSVKGRKPWKDRRVSDDELEWGLSPEGGVSQSA